ncbi:ribose-phosphate diphosphokinase [Aestuariivirga sp.]|uniref:ribose-phosphate diphosphokinase n=1 Tax=Aestuariivirga sp. TaxID=2650926 RepID=UPI00391D34AC
MRPVIFAMPGNEALASSLSGLLKVEDGRLEHRIFPDGESYLRFLTPVAGRSVALACSLFNPDHKVLPLLLAAAALRDQGAIRVGLVAPYLAYMRQDKQFNDGEAVTSRGFARLVSASFDWIVTVDPHLHRYKSLDELYTVPVGVGHAAPVLAAYLRPRQGRVFMLGPDEESEQWVAAVAAAAGAPHIVMQKTRRGDRDVSITFSGLGVFQGRTPVLVDDVISSGKTMEVAVRQLVRLGFASPICLAVHGVLAEDAKARLEEAGAEVVTTNTIPGAAARLDVGPLLAKLVAPYLTGYQSDAPARPA